MKRKNMKAAFILAIAVAVLMNPVAVLAHGHHHNKENHHKESQAYGSCVTYSQCSVSGCRKMKKHKHGRTYYYGHSNGKKVYSQCTVSGCSKTKKHKHNGKCYYGHSSIKAY